MGIGCSLRSWASCSWGIAGILASATIGCASAPPLAANCTEDDAPLPVSRVGSGGGLGFGRDVIFVALEDDRRLVFDFAQPPSDGPMGFTSEVGIPPVRVYLEQSFPGSHVLLDLCESEDGADGQLLVRALSRDDGGYIDGLDATLEIQFVGCTSTWEGRALGNTRFVVELPGEP